MRLIVVEEDGFYYLFLVLRAALILGHHKFEGSALSNALFFYIEKRLILELRLNVLISFCDLSLEHSLGSRVGTVVRALV